MADDVQIVVGIQGKTEGAKLVKRELDGVTNSANKTVKSVDELDTAFNRTNRRMQAAEARLKELALQGQQNTERFGRLKKQTDEYRRSLSQAEKAIRDVNEETKKGAKSVNAFGTAIKGAFAAIGVREVVRTIDQFTLLEARVKNSTRSVQEFNTAFRALRDVSAQTGASFESAVEVFQRISFVRDEIDATSETMVQFTANVQKLGVVSGASTQALNAGLTQLGQGLSSGILRAEEFNSILENIPAVGVAIAKEFGVTTGQLRNLVLDGQVLSEDVFAAILNQTQDINKQFDQFPKTIGRAFNEFLLQLQSSASELDKVVGLTQILIEGFRIAGNVLESLVGLIQGFGNTIKAFFSLVIAGILDAFNSATRLIENLINTAIRGINRLKREDIPLLDISSDVSRADLSEAALTAARSEIDQARQGFLRAFESAADIFNGGQNDPVARQVESTRELSKNYKDIAATLSDNEKKTKKVKKETSEYEKAVKKLTDTITDDFADAFSSAFKKSGNIFDGFVDGLKNSFGSFLDFMIKEASRPIAVNLVGALTGVVGGATAGSSSSFASGISSILGSGSSGGGVGGLGGLFSAGKSFFTGGSMAFNSSIGGFASRGAEFLGGLVGLDSYAAAELGNTVGGFAGQAFSPSNVLGGAIGGIGANLLGLGSQNALVNAGASTIGGVVGQALIPVPVLGAAIGSFLGTAIGGLFGGGSTPSRAIDRGFGLGDDGLLKTIRSTSDEASDEQVKAFNKLSSSVNESVNTLISSLGAQLESIPNFIVSQTRREGIQASVGTFAESSRKSFKSLQDAIDFALTGALSQADLSGVSAEFEQIFKDIFAKGGSIEDRINEVVEAKAIFDLIDSFEAAADTTSPLISALEALDAQFADLKQKALDLGLPVDKLTDAYEAQRKALIDNTLKPLQDFLDSQALSNISSLSPTDRLSFARQQFDENLAAISSGDYSNINALTNQASQLLQIGRDVFASGAGFTALESFVRQSVVGVGEQLGGAGSLDANIGQEIVISNAEQISLLQQQNVIIQQQAEEIRKLRKSMERVGNLLVVQS